MSVPAGSRRDRNLRIPGGKICAVAREQPHALLVAPSKNAEAIVLDFVKSSRARPAVPSPVAAGMVQAWDGDDATLDDGIALP